MSEIANTIHAQIGAPSFFMIGAKNIMGTERGLQFKIMRNANKVTHVTVELATDDTYTITFHSCRGTSIKVLSKVEGVQVAELHSTISRATSPTFL